MSNAEEILKTLSPEKRALFELLLKKKRMNNNAFSLSASQKRMWFMQKLDPGSALFNIPAATQIHGKVDPDLLDNCFRQLIGRHTVLQCIFPQSGEEPCCTRREFDTFRIQITDLRHLNEPDRRQQAVSQIEKESRTAFDISSELLIRVRLFILSDEESVLFILMHHIISDGWSMQLIIRELAALYSAGISRLPSPLPPLLIQYEDYVKWQSEWLISPAMHKQRDYWKEKLGGLPGKITFSGNSASSGKHSYSGKHIYRRIPGSCLSRLKNLYAASNASMFMITLAVFKTLLLRITGQQDIVIGTPVANRNLAGSQGIVGLFVNTVLLRDDLSGSLSFIEILQKVKTTVLEAYENQEFPFDELVKEFNPDRSLSQAELFNVMFLYQNSSPDIFSGESHIRLTPLDLENELSAFDLSFSVSELKDELLINVEYSAGVLSAEYIDLLIGSFARLAEAVSDDPQQKISGLPLIDEETHAGLCRINYSAQLPFSDIVSKICETAAVSGESIAVIEGEKYFTYKELDTLSGKIAAFLLKKGIKTEDRIGISLSRSFNLIAGLIGILKAGGVYVPLDPNYPSDRTRYMIEDSGLKILLTEDKFLQQYLPLTGNEIISLDSEKIQNQPVTNITTSIDPDNGAYIIYTSGSTGMPKGVLVTHKSVVNHNCFISRIFELTPADRVLQFSTVNFDAAVEEIFPALQCGACLVLRNSELLPSAGELLEQISKDKITVLDMTTSYWHELVRELSENSSLTLPSSIRLAAIGGESLNPERAGQWKEITKSKAKLLNTYGPTETTVISSSYEADGWEETIPIGKPIDNTALYIVDNYMNLVPPGIHGELLIGGIGLARCYLNKPGLTAEKFIPDPFSKIPGQRLYRSGDIARMRKDGNVEYSGRKDGQIKLRGFRIETSEIERALESVEGISKAIVILDTRSGLKRLIGFYTSSGNIEPMDLKGVLKKTLPDYMVPAFLVRLDAFPLALNGKIDFSKLRDINPASANSLPPEDRPEMTETETALASIWKDLLNVEFVSPNDNFFDAGGHSLLLTRLAFRINKTFGISFSLREAFDNAQLRAMARNIDLKMATGSAKDSSAEKIPLSDVKTLSYSQLRLWALDQIDKLSSVYNIPSVFSLKGYLNYEYLEQSINMIAARHEILRANIVTVDGKPNLIINESMKIKLPVHSVNSNEAAENSTEIRDLIIQEAKKPFNLASGPLIRAILIECGGGEYLFMLNIHHIIFDGWSSAIFIHELIEIYSALAEGRNAVLPELNIQYPDYAAWQKQHLQGSVLEDALRYWRSKLDGIPADLILPYDYPVPEVQKSDGMHETIIISREVLQSSIEICRNSDVTGFIFFLAIFNILLRNYSGQDDICIGTPAANRTNPETENLIGLFVNTIVLRTKMEADLPFKDLLEQVKDTVIGAYLHQHLPFEKLVEVINPERRTNRNPLFQVMFIYNNSESRIHSNTPGITVGTYAFENGISMFDLSLILEESTDGLITTLEYNTGLFKSSTASAILKDFASLVQSAVEKFNCKISDLNTLSLLKSSSSEITPAENAPASTEPQAESRAFIPVNSQDYRRKLNLLTNVWKEVLHYDNPAPADNFFEVGGDSILAIQMVAKARTRGIIIEVIDIFRNQTLQELAAIAGYAEINITEQGPVFGESRLIPVQKWFFEQNFAEPSHWNQSVLINLKEKTSPAIIELVLRHIVNHHDALRSRFRNHGNEWIQIIDLPVDTAPLEIIKAGSTAPSDDFIRLHAGRIQQSLNIMNGPVIKAALFQMDDTSDDKLLIAAHHLVIDGISWMILIEDMQTIFNQLKAGETVSLPVKATSFKSWSQKLHMLAQSDKVKNEAAYWTGRPFYKVRPPEPDFASGTGTEAGSKSIVGILCSEKTNLLLQDIPGRTKYTVMEILITALARSYAQWSGRRTLAFDLESHGRERIAPEIDVSRTCGWFTSIYPVVLDLEDKIFTGDTLEIVRKQLNEIPANGFNYGLLRYLCSDPEIHEGLSLIPQSQICFNYLGKMNLGSGTDDSNGQTASGLKGIERSRNNHLTHMLDINAVVSSDTLQVEWAFSSSVFADAAIRRLADLYIRELGNILDFCLMPGDAERSAADFRMVNLSQKELNGILKKVNKNKGIP